MPMLLHTSLYPIKHIPNPIRYNTIGNVPRIIPIIAKPFPSCLLGSFLILAKAFIPKYIASAPNIRLTNGIQKANENKKDATAVAFDFAIIKVVYRKVKYFSMMVGCWYNLSCCYIPISLI